MIITDFKKIIHSKFLSLIAINNQKFNLLYKIIKIKKKICFSNSIFNKLKYLKKIL